MGKIFLTLIITLSTLFSTLHAITDDSPEILRDNRLIPRSRTLLQYSQIAADPPAEMRRILSEEESPAAAESPVDSRKLGKHHSSSDKSAAGGGVIIGGLLTAVCAAVFCYIRVTRRRHVQDLK